MSLTVTDLPRSVDWYQQVLGFEVHSEVQGATFRRTRLRHPVGGIMFTLTQHDEGSGDRFDETRTGLDHVAFALDPGEDLEAFVRRLDDLDVDHSPVKPTATGGGGNVVIRDPDNVQLEVFLIPG
jgi:glyoxylase I family protein